MKRILLALLVLFGICSAGGTALADGEYYCSSDIVAYIDGRPIKSYNIDGYTGIVAEDLQNYKFRVVYWDEHRILLVSFVYGDLMEITADYSPEPPTLPNGTPLGKIYNSDIRVQVGDCFVHGYNIGGQTLILIDELEAFGDVVWYPEERKICYTSRKTYWEHKIEADEEVEPGKAISGFSLDLSHSGDEYSESGENLNYLDYPKISNSKRDGFCFSFSIYQRVLFETEALFDTMLGCLNTNYEQKVISEDTAFANEHIKAAVNGQPVSVRSVGQGKGNGHVDFYVYLDCNIKEEEELSSFSIKVE